MSQHIYEYYQYTEERLGIIDTLYDIMYVQSDYGYLVEVPFSLHQNYFQDH
jgi:hypothetical protein